MLQKMTKCNKLLKNEEKWHKIEKKNIIIGIAVTKWNRLALNGKNEIK